MDDSSAFGCGCILILILISVICTYPVQSIGVIGFAALGYFFLHIVNQAELAQQKKELTKNLTQQKESLTASKRDVINQKNEVEYLLTQNNDLREYCQEIIEKEVERKCNYYLLLEKD